MKKLVLLVLITLSLFACTDNQRARTFGGTERVSLAPNTKLINATWKGDELWLLTSPMDSTDTGKEYQFVEKSSYGVLEGKVIIVQWRQ